MTEPTGLLAPSELDAINEASGSCACANLRRVTRVVTREFDEAMRNTGFRSTQISILIEIARMGDAPVGELARVLAMDASTLTRNLTPLERDGLIAARKTQAGRRRSVRLTPAGAAVLRTAIPLWQSAQEKFLARVPEASWSSIRTQLSGLTN